MGHTKGTFESSAKGHLRKGLPASAYRDPSFWEEEQRKLFPSTWTFVGFAHELQQPGDARPIRAAGRPLVLLRDNNLDLRVFHNVCRHRCLKLVKTPGNLGRTLVCPYHAWTYGLDGALRNTPYFGGPAAHLPPGFDRKEHGLVPVRFHLWHDWIFVNLDGKAPAFEDYAAPLLRHLVGIDFSRLRHQTTIDLGEVRCNWKLLMENFIEPYHVQFVHAGSTDQPLLDHATLVDPPCLGSLVDVGEGTEKRSGTLAVSSRYLTLFPNFVFGRYFPDQIGVHLNEPLAPGLTRQRRAIYSSDGTDFPAEKVAALAALWTRVHREDHEICERLQEGRESEIAGDGGVLSPHWEDSLRAFEDLVEAAVSA
jgi:choline monooxygenase